MTQVNGKISSVRRTCRTRFYKHRKTKLFLGIFQNFIVFFPVSKVASSYANSRNNRNSGIFKHSLLALFYPIFALKIRKCSP